MNDSEHYPEAAADDNETPREEGPETTLVPKSMHPHAKVGDTIKHKVVSLLDNEIEVEGAGMDKGKTEDEPMSSGEADDNETMDSRIARIPMA